MMKNENLIRFKEINGFIDIVDQLKGDITQVPVSLPRSVRLPFMAALQENIRKPLLFITSKADRLQSMFEEYVFWSQSHENYIFAEPAPLFYEKINWGAETRRERMETLVSLTKSYLPGYQDAGTPEVIFTSMKSIMTLTIPRRKFIKACSTLRTGESKHLDELCRHWVEIGYTHAELVTSAGQFSRRGGLVDVWPIQMKNPVRVDFFGDEIDSMRVFDPASQRSIEKVTQVFIPPAGELIGYTGELAEDPDKPLIEFNIPLAYSSPASLLEFLPKGSIILLDNAASLQVTAEEIELQAVKLRHEAEDSASIPDDFPLPYTTWSEISDNLTRFSAIDLGFPLGQEGHSLSKAFSPGPRFGSQLNDLFNFISRVEKKNSQIFIVSSRTTA